MEREQRYIVLKIKDMEAAGFALGHIDAFNEVCDAVNIARIQRGAGLLECAVVEKDWPEYDVVWQMIANRVDKKDEPIQKLFADIRERFSYAQDAAPGEAVITRAEYNELMAAFSAWSIEQQKMPAKPYPVGIGTGAQALASEVVKAYAADAHGEGHDIEAGLFGPNMTALLRKIATEYLGKQDFPNIGEFPLQEGGA